jgi:hypothetical protein
VFTSGKFGSLAVNHRFAACAFAIIAMSGWLSSWAIEADNSAAVAIREALESLTRISRR